MPPPELLARLDQSCELCPAAVPNAITAEPAAITKLPGVAAVCALLDSAGNPVMLAGTQHLRRFVNARLNDPTRAQRGKADLAAIVRRVCWRRVHCLFEQRWLYYRLARLLHPRDYRRRISFGPAWFLHLDRSGVAPQIRITKRLAADSADFAGPWPGETAAHEALSGLLDLFELCRYPEQVRKAPLGRRCAYADMGRCDAPCDGSAALADYESRTQAAWEFACGGVEAWIMQAQQRMRAAAAEQRFELAGLLKRQIAFASIWQTRWSGMVRSADRMTCALVIRATRRAAWKLFAFRAGVIDEGPLLGARRIAEEGARWIEQSRAAQPHTAARSQTSAPAKPAAPKATIAAAGEDDALDPQIRLEQTWLLSHFLFHTEAERALILRPAELAPGELAQRLSELATSAGG